MTVEKMLPPLFQRQHVLTSDSNPAIIHLPSLMTWAKLSRRLQISSTHIFDGFVMMVKKKLAVLAFRDIKRADGPMINSHHR